ncbi:MAG TPA: hypothetical protein VF642_08305 [Propionibacteriaceae bacterium]
MSALWAPVIDPTGTTEGTETTEAPTRSRPLLRAVPRALPRLARVPFILVLIAIFAVGMTGLLMLNTTLQNQAFQASTLNRQATELAYTQADLESRLDLAAAPQVLAQRATALGLRANPYPAFLVLPKGKVQGRPQAVKGDEVPATIVRTPAELAAERAAKLAEKRAKAVQAAVDARARAVQERIRAAQKKVEDARKAKDKAAAAKKKAADAVTARRVVAQQAAAQRVAAQKAAAQRAAAQKAAQKAAAERAAAARRAGTGQNGGRG